MRVTAKQLAKELGISEAAVSMALHNKPGVSTRTRKQVLVMAEKMGYDMTRINDTQSSSFSGFIYLMIYRKNGTIVSENPFFSELTEGIDLACRSYAIRYQISHLYEKPSIEEQLEKAVEQGCTGIILLATEMSETDFQPFTRLREPIVVMDNYFENTPADYVMIDNAQGSYMATDYLIKKYHDHPGYLRASFRIGNFNERENGFFSTIRRNGQPVSKTVVHNLSPTTEGAYADMSEILRSGEKPARCYFADNDLIAGGAMRALQEFGYRIPEDVAVIGFDDMPLCRYVNPSITTVNVPKHALGNMAVQRMKFLMSGHLMEPIKACVRTSLVLRESA